MQQFKLFYRNGCHLCEDMQQLLHPYEITHKITIELINVDRDTALQEKYGLLIPVLTDQDETMICHYFFDKVSFEQSLALK